MTVSILTPTITDREWFLDRCKRSVAAQGLPLEHKIVQGDGLIPAEAFQKALDESSGEFVMPVSDDDWIAPHAVETFLSVLEQHDVVFAKTVIINTRNDYTHTVAPGGAVMWRRSLTDSIGGFDPRWKHAGDSDLYGRFMYSGARIGFVPEPLYFQTAHAEHGGFLHRDALDIELQQIHERYPDAAGRLYGIVNQI